MRLRTFFMILGFLLVVLGVLSLVLRLIGANLSYLAWIRIFMIGGGLVMSYMALNPPEQEKDDITPGQ